MERSPTSRRRVSKDKDSLQHVDEAAGAAAEFAHEAPVLEGRGAEQIGFRSAAIACRKPEELRGKPLGFVAMSFTVIFVCG